MAAHDVPPASILGTGVATRTAPSSTTETHGSRGAADSTLEYSPFCKAIDGPRSPLNSPVNV
jgi:hypothetical protein